MYSDQDLGVPTKSFSKTILQISNKSRGLGCEGSGLERIAGREAMGRIQGRRKYS